MWENLSYFIGTWQGKGSGQSGNSLVDRSYQLILNGRFMEVKNKSTYPPQSQNPQGEVHQDIGFFSFDKSRKTYVLRQFHIEGFVNQYVMDTLSSDGQAMVFTSENIENIQAGWRARETYQILSSDEFTETFELAEPGKDFELYVRTQFSRLT